VFEPSRAMRLALEGGNRESCPQVSPLLAVWSGPDDCVQGAIWKGEGPWLNSAQANAQPYSREPRHGEAAGTEGVYDTVVARRSGP
jgi:hypothetical protein